MKNNNFSLIALVVILLMVSLAGCTAKLQTHKEWLNHPPVFER